MPPRRQSNPRSPEHAALGEAVRVLREQAGLSQEALADAAHVHVTLLGPLERGTGNPNYATIVKLAHALNTTPGTIVARADDIAKTQARTSAKANASRTRRAPRSARQR
jgi:transcriptional regulator with XRE-family HTH domain